jgi:hypothetical protein
MLQDFLGREIKAGDTVCYPVRRGSDMRLTTMKIDYIEDNVLTGCKAGRRFHVRNLNNCIVVTA